MFENVAKHRGQKERITLIAQELGRRGGRARAKALSAERRSEIARKAAASRWRKAKA